MEGRVQLQGPTRVRIRAYMPMPQALAKHKIKGPSAEAGVIRPLTKLCCGLGGWTEGLLVRRAGASAATTSKRMNMARSAILPSWCCGTCSRCTAPRLPTRPDRRVAAVHEYSYMAMPWSRAKQIARALRGEDEFPDPYRGSRTIADLNAIFDACFRIQREASEAAGRHIPMVVENVKGAQPWVGRARGASAASTFGATCRR
jgi:hypothetical protein